MYFQLLRWECISYHSMQCAADTPTVSVGIIMQCAANSPNVSLGIINWLRIPSCTYSHCFGGNRRS